jgi:uncharacterized protein YecT (DUF1311 family)
MNSKFQAMIIALIFFLIGSEYATAQNANKIQNLVEKEVKAYRQKLSKSADLDTLMIAFSVDTFRIEHLYAATIVGMVNSPKMLEVAEQATAAYDVLLNKYYNRLLAKLNGDDKKALVKTQKAWLAFRNEELNWIGTVGQEAYTGGGSVQKDVNESTYQELIKSRLIQIFNHLNRIGM